MELIFEIGAEDIPARFVDDALDQMQNAFEKACEEDRIAAEGVVAYGTPRRLVLTVKNLASSQSDLEEVRTGPPAQVAFKDGAPTGAAQGFARGQGVDVSDLYTVETEKGEYVAAKVFETGAPTLERLPEILSGVLRGLHFPKSMRWADYRESFARPIRWIVAVADGEVVPVDFAGVESGRKTRGHRFAAPDAIDVSSIDAYISDLREAHVVVDQAERRKAIEEGIALLGEQAGGAVVDDPGLVDEVIHLVEEPHPVLVNFSSNYLELPDEVLISSMRKHQRYFAIADAKGNLLPACGVIYNTPVRDPDVVAAGNLRVLKARLDDARFFWEQDLRAPIESFVEKLDRVIWLKQIGTMKERSARVSMTAARIAEAIGASEDTVEHARRAGYLAKADLVTQMVGEFPDLQGVMGREYARHAGEPDEVAVAIHEQYLPKGAADDTPQTDAGACLALAERLDSLVGCFGIGLEPTSASDPYALRRAALGVIRILQERAYTVSLPELIELARSTYDDLDEGVLETGGDELDAKILGFVGTRLENQLAKDYPTDVVQAVLAVGLEDVLSITDRVEALAALRDEPDFEPLAQGFKRVVNILKKQAADFDLDTPVDPEVLAEDAEKALYDAANEAEDAMEVALNSRDWERACQILIKLKGPVDEFFDNVMVMTDDAAIKRNRLALLADLRSLFRDVADISEIG